MASERAFVKFERRPAARALVWVPFGRICPTGSHGCSFAESELRALGSTCPCSGKSSPQLELTAAAQTVLRTIEREGPLQAAAELRADRSPRALGQLRLSGSTPRAGRGASPVPLSPGISAQVVC